MDHDRLFKQLLREFFIEFLALFFPKVLRYIDRGSIEFLPPEIFTDITGGERHEVDLVVKARFRGRDAFFLIHIENQASAQRDFPRRMFNYYARLHLDRGLPVYPIAIFSFDKPGTAQPDTYRVVFPDREVLRFRYRTVQLNRLNWRSFVRHRNPLAAALMAKMRIAPAERPRVKLACLRLIATLKLNPARLALIRVFVDSYLRLNAAEMVQMERDMKTLKPAEQEAVEEVLNEWVEKGMEQGRRQGKEELVLRLLARRLRSVPADMARRIADLPPESLEELGEELGEALLEFQSIDDVRAWLAGR